MTAWYLRFVDTPNIQSYPNMCEKYIRHQALSINEQKNSEQIDSFQI